MSIKISAYSNATNLLSDMTRMSTLTTMDDPSLETLVNGAYTYREFLLILSQNCPQFQERLRRNRVKSIKFLDINNGQGYLSNIYKTSIEFQNDSKPFSLIIKIPTTAAFEAIISDKSRLNELADKTHRTECEFYEMFRDVNDGFAPGVYYTEVASNGRPGCIIMDDLSERCTTFGLLRTYTTQQFWNVAKKVAHLQAVAACRGKDLSAFTDEYHTDRLHIDVFNPDALLDYDPKFKEPVERMRKIWSKKFSKYALIDKPTEYNCLALQHGDLWTNNILFERSKDGSVSDTPLLFIDWQVVFGGNPFFDICRFLIVSGDAEVRREIQENLVEDFYAMLKKEYKELSNGRVNLNFTLEQAHELFELAFLEQAINSTIILPFVLSNKSAHGSPTVVKAKLEKIALKAWLCLQDALDIVDRRKLDGFAEGACVCL